MSSPRAPRPRVRVSVRGRFGACHAGKARTCARWLAEAGRAAGLGPDHELSLLLCDGSLMRRLNRRWRSIDRSTNVLAFPLHELKPGDFPGRGALGDIALALPVAGREARLGGLDADEHVARLLVHGLLHLLGYDHPDDRRARLMERREAELLARIGMAHG